jgi:four helix bundle protein
MKTPKIRKIKFWEGSIHLMPFVSSYCKGFIKDKSFPLISPINQCSYTLLSNIDEGSVKSTKLQFTALLSIGRSASSSSDLSKQLIIAIQRNFGNQEQCVFLCSALEEMQKMNLYFSAQYSYFKSIFQL